MGETFYATIAQVIPVFLLTGAVELRFFDRYRTKLPDERGFITRHMSPIFYHRLAVSIVGASFFLSMVGVAAAISGTQTKEPSAFVETMTVVGLATSIMFVVTPMFDRLRTLWKSDPQEGEEF